MIFYILALKYSTCYSCHILMKSEFSRHIFEKKTLISNFMKIRPVRAELFHAYERAEGYKGMMKLIIAFRNFANAPKND